MHNADLTQEQVADALSLVAQQMKQGMPVAAVYVAEHGVTILATTIGAVRWREVHGDTLGGYPLNVTAVAPIGLAS